MERTIIEIDEERCNGCGICAKACHEGAIEMIDGKAKLVRDDYCDGLGDCLPVCPTDAIRFVKREAKAYDPDAVARNLSSKSLAPTPFVCPGKQEKTIAKAPQSEPVVEQTSNVKAVSELMQWPCQIKLMNPFASYFNNAKLLIAADCTAYAYASFHEDFMKDRITLVGCPKLDAIDYSEKLTEILANNEIRDVLLVRMEVPCCGGMENALKKALQQSGKLIPWRVVTVSTDGRILD